MRHIDRWRIPRAESEDADSLTHDSDESLEDFDETISADLESTRKGMLAYKRNGGTEVQFRRDQMEVNDQVAAELKQLRKKLAQVVQGVNRKAPKSAIDKVMSDIEAARVKRWETTRNWIVVVIAFGGLVATIIKELR